jgi:NAD(P)H-nitrite reductase large subunit
LDARRKARRSVGTCRPQEEHRIDLTLGARVVSIDTASRQVHLADGTRHAHDALLLATGAGPVRLEAPGGDLPCGHYLRTLADSRALIATALASQRAAVIGVSFIDSRWPRGPPAGCSR